MGNRNGLIVNFLGAVCSSNRQLVYNNMFQCCMCAFDTMSIEAIDKNTDVITFRDEMWGAVVKLQIKWGKSTRSEHLQKIIAIDKIK